jgi:hypothetical protein
MIYLLIVIILSFGTLRFFIRRSLAISHDFINIFALVAMLCVSSFRADDVGADTYTYKSIYFGLDSINSYHSIDIFFKYLILALKVSGAGIFSFQFVASALCLVPLYIGICCYLKHHWQRSFALLLYFLSFFLPYNLNGVRQSIAMGLSVYIFSIVDSRGGHHVVRAGLFPSILASGIHFASVISLLSYFGLTSIFRLRLFYFGPIFAILCLLLSTLILPYDFSQFQGLQSYQGLAFGDRDSVGFVVLARIAVYSVYFSAAIIALNLRVTGSSRVWEMTLACKLLSYYLIGLCLFFLILPFSPAGATRLFYFFKVSEIVSLPLICSFCKPNLSSVAIFLLFAAPSFYNFAIDLSSGLYRYSIL